MRTARFSNGVANVDCPAFTLSDQFATVAAKPIIQHGMDTGYLMMYKKVKDRGLNEEVFIPVGTVSKDWTPVQSEPLIEEIRGRLIEAGLADEDMQPRVKLASRNIRSTTHRIDFELNKSFELPFAPRDGGHRMAPIGNMDRDVYKPRVTFWNGYTGCCGLRGGLTVMRMVCSNGLVVPVFTGQIYNLHTSTAAGIFVNKLLSLSFLTGMKEMQAFLTKAADKTVSPELLENIVPHFGKKELEEWNGYPDHSAGGVINFLSYQQTHVATIAAESKYQGWINQIVREAA